MTSLAEEKGILNEDLDNKLDVTSEFNEDAEEQVVNDELKEFVKTTVSEELENPEDLNSKVVLEEGPEKEKKTETETETRVRQTRRQPRAQKDAVVNLGTDLMPEAYHEQSKKVFTPVEDWKGIHAAVASKLLVRAEVTGVDDNEGKIYVEVGNVQGVIPLSESGITKETKSLVWLVGRTICFVIKAADEKNGFFVASRSEGLTALAEAVKKQLKVGEIRTGVVSRLEIWGAWIELGGVYARLPRRELMHHFVNNIGDVIEPGDLIDVRITDISETGRVRVSLKQALPNPWDKVSHKYKVGMIKGGKITGIIPGLVFIQFEPGIDAVAPWPKFPIREGQKVSAKIHEIDVKKERMSAAIWKTND